MGLISTLRSLVSGAAAPGVVERVQVTSVKPGEERLLGKSGQIQMITDGENCLVAFDDGRTSVLKLSQLKRL